jgi:hypothetical protein
LCFIRGGRPSHINDPIIIHVDGDDDLRPKPSMKRKRDETPESRASAPLGTAGTKIKYTKETLPEELQK